MTRRITLKLATSLDGRIATASGESRWITCPEARQAVHGLRAQHQAVLVGVETVIADDPALTVRLEDYQGPQPRRIVLDSRQRIPLTSALVSTAAQVPTILITTHPSNKRLTDAGVTVLQVPERDARVDLAAAVDGLGRRGRGDGADRRRRPGGGELSRGRADRHDRVVPSARSCWATKAGRRSATSSWRAGRRAALQAG